MVGHIANDLFPHLSMYIRAFFPANAFLFFKQILAGVAVSRVGMRTRFDSGCPSVVVT